MLSEAVLSVERTGLPYFVDHGRRLGQRSRSPTSTPTPRPRPRSSELAAAAGQSRTSRRRLAVAQGWLDIAKGLILKDDARLLRELQKQHKVRLYLVSTSARPLAEIDTPERRRAGASRSCRRSRPTGSQTRLGDGVRQVLTELRGAPPSAIVLLTDGQTTDGESRSPRPPSSPRARACRSTPIGLGEPRAGPRPRADRAAGRRRRLRRRPRPVPGQAARPGASPGRRSPSGSRSRTPGSTDPKAARDLETIRGQRPARRPAEAGRARPPAQGDRRAHLHPRGRAPAPRAPDREQPDRAHGQRPQGEAQGPARRQRAALRVPLPEELPRARGDDRPERRPALVRPRVQRAGPLGPADLPRRQGRPVRLRRGPPRRRRPELPEPVADAEPRRVRHREGGRHPVHRRRELQPARATAARRWSCSCRSSWPRPATRPPSGNAITVVPARADRSRGGRARSSGSATTRRPAPRSGRTCPSCSGTSRPRARSRPRWSWPSTRPLTGSDGKLPLFLYQFVGAGKSMFHAVDDTWRWRFRVGDRYFGRFWIQTIRFLARSKLLGQRQAEIQTDRRRYQRNQPIQIRVRFPNPGLRPGRRRGRPSRSSGRGRARAS